MPHPNTRKPRQTTMTQNNEAKQNNGWKSSRMIAEEREREKVKNGEKQSNVDRIKESLKWTVAMIDKAAQDVTGGDGIVKKHQTPRGKMQAERRKDAEETASLPAYGKKVKEDWKRTQKIRKQLIDAYNER